MKKYNILLLVIVTIALTGCTSRYDPVVFASVKSDVFYKPGTIAIICGSGNEDELEVISILENNLRRFKV